MTPTQQAARTPWKRRRRCITVRDTDTMETLIARGVSPADADQLIAFRDDLQAIANGPPDEADAALERAKRWVTR